MYKKFFVPARCTESFPLVTRLINVKRQGFDLKANSLKTPRGGMEIQGANCYPPDNYFSSAIGESADVAGKIGTELGLSLGHLHWRKFLPFKCIGPAGERCSD